MGRRDARLAYVLAAMALVASGMTAQNRAALGAGVLMAPPAPLRPKPPTYECYTSGSYTTCEPQ
jgi:hypothetical protein